MTRHIVLALFGTALLLALPLGARAGWGYQEHGPHAIDKQQVPDTSPVMKERTDHPFGKPTALRWEVKRPAEAGPQEPPGQPIPTTTITDGLGHFKAREGGR